MLGRIIKAADQLGTEIAFLDSTESPFLYYDKVDELFEQQVREAINLSSVSELPDGASPSLVDIESLRISHQHAQQRNKELVTSYIFDHQGDFKINMLRPEEKLRRSDIRITVDYPEDLVFCRRVYQDLRGRDRLIQLTDIIDYWDADQQRRRPVEEIGVDWGHGRIWA
jgi:spore coat polysaccharide biosynthesis protein SpsF